MTSRNVAVVVAHPDDEVLAFGGVMARHTDRGDRVSVLILATGLSSRTPDGSIDDADLESLRADACAANRILGVEAVEFGDFPDNRMDSVALLDVVKRVEAFFGVCEPVIVYTHFVGDANVDHAVTARAVLAATRPLPDSKISRLFAGEVLSSSEYGFPADRFVPNFHCEIAASLDRKVAAMQAYKSEIRKWPHPRSPEAIRALAQLRGAEIGAPAAEALQLVRGCDR